MNICGLCTMISRNINWVDQTGVQSRRRQLNDSTIILWWQTCYYFDSDLILQQLYILCCIIYVVKIFNYFNLVLMYSISLLESCARDCIQIFNKTIHYNTVLAYTGESSPLHGYINVNLINRINNQRIWRLLRLISHCSLQVCLDEIAYLFIL